MKRSVFGFMLVLMLMVLAACGESEKPQVTEESNLVEDSISGRERWPFSDLDAEDIAKVNINLTPPDANIKLTQKQIVKLVDILKRIEIYQKTSPEALSGQAMECKITKKNGSIIDFEDMGSIFVIDGVWYKSGYEGSERLNTFANGLLEDDMKIAPDRQ